MGMIVYFRKMCSIGRNLPLYSITPQFIFSLSGSEKVRRKFRTSHVVKYTLIFFKSFSFMNIVLIKSAIKPLYPAF